MEKLFPSRSLFKNLKCLIIAVLNRSRLDFLSALLFYSSPSSRDIEKFVLNPENFHFHRRNDVFHVN